MKLRRGPSRPSAKIVQLDLDETLIGQNRAADVGLVGQPRRHPRAMLDVMADEDVKLDFRAYRDELRAREVELEAGWQASWAPTRCPIDPLRLCREIADVDRPTT